MTDLAQLLLTVAAGLAGMAGGLGLVLRLGQRRTARPGARGPGTSGFAARGPVEDGWTEGVRRDGGLARGRASSFNAPLLEEDKRGAAGEFASHG